MKYSIATSTTLDGWIRYCPRDVFPALLARLEDPIQRGDPRATEEVRYEPEKQDDKVLACTRQQDRFFVPLDYVAQYAVSAILTRCPKLIDRRRGRSGADPFANALAKVCGGAVVTGERASHSQVRPMVPDVCQKFGIRSMSLIDLTRTEAWVFVSSTPT